MLHIRSSKRRADDILGFFGQLEGAQGTLDSTIFSELHRNADVYSTIQSFIDRKSESEKPFTGSWPWRHKVLRKGSDSILRWSAK